MKFKRMSFANGSWSEPFDPAMNTPETLVIAFAAPGYIDDPAPLRALRAALSRAHVVGCSTAGEIHGAKVLDESIAVVMMRFGSATLKTAHARVAAGHSARAGAALGEALAAPDLRAVFALSDGLAVNGSELARGINARLPADVVVTGGLAGDGARFARTWVLDEEGLPAPGLVSAVGIRGARVSVRHGSKGGWDNFGPERLITRAEGNVLFELDGKPALELYKRYLGERAAGLPATALLFPLSVRVDGDGADERRLVRTILSVDEAQQSMTFAGDIPQGARAQLMRANFDRLVMGASDAAQMARMEGPVVNLAISCVGRRLVLGGRIEEETEAAFDMLAAGSEQVGYYSYGELSPFVSGAPCELHNQTMTVTTLGEL